MGLKKSSIAPARLDNSGKARLNSRAKVCSYMADAEETSRPEKKARTAAITAADAPDHPLWDPSWTAALGETTIAQRASSQTADVTFYAAWFSGRTSRVWIALEELGVDYRWIECNPYAVDPAKKGGYSKKALSLEEKRKLNPDWIATSPWGLVPALSTTDIDGKQGHAWESLPMVDFLDEKYGSGNPDSDVSLLPKSLFARSRIRIFLSVFDNEINTPASKMLIGVGDKQQWSQQVMHGIRKLANAMAPIEQGPFFLGEQFSLFEVNTAGFWWRWDAMLVQPGILVIDEDPDTIRFTQWWNAVSKRPSVLNTTVSTQRMIDSNIDYMTGQSTSNFAKSLKAK